MLIARRHGRGTYQSEDCCRVGESIDHMHPAGTLVRHYCRTDTTVGTGCCVEMVLLGLITQACPFLEVLQEE